jgi:Tol biopolymer transport system component
VYVYDRIAGTTERIPAGSDGGMSADISGDGRYVVFTSWSDDAAPGDTNRTSDVFIHDRQTRETKLVSVTPAGAAAESGGGSPRISGNGRFVLFESGSADIVAGDTNGEDDVFVRDMLDGTTRRVSVATGGGQLGELSRPGSISNDGRSVTFSTDDPAAVPGDTNSDLDVFLHDTASGQTVLISRGYDGQPAKYGFSYSPEISGDGTHVGFWSNAWNIVENDTNMTGDFFVWERATGLVTRASVTSSGAEANGADGGVLSGDGTVAVYRASATNLVEGDTNGKADVFRTELS